MRSAPQPPPNPYYSDGTENVANPNGPVNGGTNVASANNVLNSNTPTGPPTQMGAGHRVRYGEPMMPIDAYAHPHNMHPVHRPQTTDSYFGPFGGYGVLCLGVCIAIFCIFIIFLLLLIVLTDW